MVNLVVRQRNASSSSPQFISARTSTSPSPKSSKNYNFPHRVTSNNQPPTTPNNNTRAANRTQYRSSSPGYYRKPLNLDLSPTTKKVATATGTATGTAETAGTTPQSFSSAYRNSSPYRFRFQGTNPAIHNTNGTHQNASNLVINEGGDDADNREKDHANDNININYDPPIPYGHKVSTRTPLQPPPPSSHDLSNLPRHIPSPIRVNIDTRPVSPLTQSESIFAPSHNFNRKRNPAANYYSSTTATNNRKSKLTAPASIGIDAAMTNPTSDAKQLLNGMNNNLGGNLHHARMHATEDGQQLRTENRIGDPDGHRYNNSDRDDRDPAPYTSHRDFSTNHILHHAHPSNTGREPANAADNDADGIDMDAVHRTGTSNDIDNSHDKNPMRHMVVPATIPTAGVSNGNTHVAFGNGDVGAYDATHKKNIDSELVCDYDVNVTFLYELLEASQWDQAKGRCRSHPMEVQTWIVRKDRITMATRWKILPLHAAVIFQAPVSVVAALIEVFPSGPNRPDDQGMLPLHLAFRHFRGISAASTAGAVAVGGPTITSQQEASASSLAAPVSSSLIEILLQTYPQGVTVRDCRNRLPVEHGKDVSSLFSIKVLQLYTQAMMHHTDETAISKVDIPRRTGYDMQEYRQQKEEIKDLEGQVEYQKERLKNQILQEDDNLELQRKEHLKELRQVKGKHEAALQKIRDGYEQQLVSQQQCHDVEMQEMQQTMQDRQEASHQKAQGDIEALRDLLASQQHAAITQRNEMEHKYQRSHEQTEQERVRCQDMEHTVKEHYRREQELQSALKHLLQDQKAVHDLCVQQQEQLEGARAIREQLLSTLMKREQESPEQRCGQDILTGSREVRQQLQSLLLTDEPEVDVDVDINNANVHSNKIINSDDVDATIVDHPEHRQHQQSHNRSRNVSNIDSALMVDDIRNDRISALKEAHEGMDSAAVYEHRKLNFPGQQQHQRLQHSDVVEEEKEHIDVNVGVHVNEQAEQEQSSQPKNHDSDELDDDISEITDNSNF